MEASGMMCQWCFGGWLLRSFFKRLETMCPPAVMSKSGAKSLCRSSGKAAKTESALERAKGALAICSARTRQGLDAARLFSPMLFAPAQEVVCLKCSSAVKGIFSLCSHGVAVLDDTDSWSRDSHSELLVGYPLSGRLCPRSTMGLFALLQIESISCGNSRRVARVPTERIALAKGMLCSVKEKRG